MINQNCLSYWFPLLQGAGLPVPRTEIVRCESDLSPLLDGDDPDGYIEFLEALESAGGRIGFPCFLRTGQTSNKHDWNKSCYVKRPDVLPVHVANLVEFSALADFLGLPTNVWAVRELLPTMPLGVCERYGGMPVCKEFRFFVRDGKIQCWHPYWPLPTLIEGGFVANVNRDCYEHLCYPGNGERKLRLLAISTADVLPGYWSVDILETKRGWKITDCALGDQSFHCLDCEHCPVEMRKQYTDREKSRQSRLLKKDHGDELR